MRGGGEGPARVLELRRGEEGADGLIGRARVTETMKPENKAASRHGKRRRAPGRGGEEEDEEGSEGESEREKDERSNEEDERP